MSKKARFLALIFEELGLHFGRVFGPFFERKIYRNGKSMLLAKTLKIVIFPRENAYFQEIEDKNQRTKSQNCNEKLHVFWNFDFRGMLDGFWGGFGRFLMVLG